MTGSKLVEISAKAGALSADVVRKQLDRILASAEFSRASRSSLFLQFVVEKFLTAPDSPSPEAEIASAVFGRKNFDSRLDPIVRVEAARLRRRIEEYYAGTGISDPIEIHLSERGYAAAAVSREATQTDAKTPQFNESGSSTLCLAVLPFTNISGDDSLDAFCLGLTEETISSITDLWNISVVSRTTASKYAGEAVDVRAVSRDLGVSHVLEGSVRQGESIFRANVNLVDCAGGGFTAWSKQFEIATDDDPLILQSSLAASIAEALEEQIRGGNVTAAPCHEKADSR